MNDNIRESNKSTTGDCIVSSEDAPLTVWTPHQSEKTLGGLDIKMRFLDYSTSLLTPIEEEPPPQYDLLPDGVSSSPRTLAHAIRSILLDHLCLKLLLVYMLTIYLTDSADLLSPFPSLDWLSDGHWTRSHSRDFQFIANYDLSEGAEIWTKSRLGRLGPYSPYLTRSEIELLSAVEWDVEPDPMTENNIIAMEWTDEEVLESSVPDIKLPLAFHQPSSLLSYSRQLFSESQRRSTLKPDSNP